MLLGRKDDSYGCERTREVHQFAMVRDKEKALLFTRGVGLVGEVTCSYCPDGSEEAGENNRDSSSAIVCSSSNLG